MPRIEIETWIDTPIDRCFDLARDVGLHCRTAAHTRERIVGDVTSGLISADDTITFEAVHFGVRQRLTSKIIEFDPPHLFVDKMQKGAFAKLQHRHEFRMENDGTTMRDVLEFTSPLGIFGKIADRLFLTRYMRRFLLIRNAALKEYAEHENPSGAI